MTAHRQALRPRRSALFMPGSRPRMHEKAKSLDADILIFDLEDASGAEEKETARAAVGEALTKGGFGRRECVVRINGLDSAIWREDLQMAAGAGADAILLPKVRFPRDIEAVDQTLEAIASDGPRLWAMIETPMAALRVGEIAAAAASTRLTGLVVGPNDLTDQLAARFRPGRPALAPLLTECVCAARAHGLIALDGVFNDLQDSEGFALEAEQGRVLGFDGAWDSPP